MANALSVRIKKERWTLFPRFLSPLSSLSLSLAALSRIFRSLVLPEDNATNYEKKKDLFLAWIHSTGGNGAAEKSGLINQELIHRNIPRIRPVPFCGCYALSSVPSKSKIAHAAVINTHLISWHNTASILTNFARSLETGIIIKGAMPRALPTI